jgi:hypothetical protein
MYMNAFLHNRRLQRFRLLHPTTDRSTSSSQLRLLPLALDVEVEVDGEDGLRGQVLRRLEMLVRTNLRRLQLIQQV